MASEGDGAHRAAAESAATTTTTTVAAASADIAVVRGCVRCGCNSHSCSCRRVRWRSGDDDSVVVSSSMLFPRPVIGSRLIGTGRARLCR